jgi:outer membrane protein assembly factor BamB
MVMTMMRCLLTMATGIGLAAATPAEDSVAHWTRFRGPDGGGLAPDGQKLPTQFGPNKNVLWKTPLPPGASSPCVWGDRIFLTAYDKPAKKLETVCLDRRDGRILWRQAAPVAKIEKAHEVSNPAASTPAADNDGVYVHFGSLGLLCYDHAGHERWKVSLPAPQSMFGTATSPILAGDLVLLNRDYRPGPCLLAVDRRTGNIAWKHEYPFPNVGFPAGRESYATPVVVDDGGVKLVVMHNNKKLAAHNLADGKEVWWVNVTSEACSSPVAADGRVYVATWVHAGEPENVVELPTFDELLKKYDKNGDGKLSKDEIPADLALIRRTESGDLPGAALTVHLFFGAFDRNHDGAIDKSEWELSKLLFKMMPSEHGLLAVKLGGKGDVTGSHVAWKEKRGLPEVASPLAYRGRVYLVKEGGIVSCLDAASGKLIYRERLGSTGAYFASPVAGDGKLYATAHAGVVSVFAVGDKLTVLARNDLGEHVLATPAIADGKLYVRTEGHLYAFGE